MSLPIDPKTQNSFRIEDDRVIVFDDLGESVVLDEFSDIEDGIKANWDANFELVGDNFLQPDEDFYQGLNFLTVIKRKSDGRLFGYERWEPVAKNAETYLDANGDQHGFENWEIPDGFNWDDDYFPTVYVFLPVEPVMLPGFKFSEVSK